MTQERWTPQVTVATVVEKLTENEPYYLLVHEAPEATAVYNQPAGHLEKGENLIDAAIRETREETGWQVAITDYLGLYCFIANNGTVYHRHGFVGQPLNHFPGQRLDDGIIDAVWMNYDDIVCKRQYLRSPMVLQLINDYRSGTRYPLSVLKEVL